MRIAIFSDIHGNKEALSSILEDIKKENINEIICLGDTIGIGPNPKECLDLLIENNVKNILGNHELYFLKGTGIDDEMTENQIKHQNWVKAQIKDYQKEYLENSSMTIEKEFNGKTILFEHFPIDYNTDEEYPFYDLKIVKEDTINEITKSIKKDLIFIGHEHNDFIIDNKLYCVGTSGCRSDNKTRYTILETDTFKIETKIIEYDRDNFEKDLRKVDYPDRNIISKWFFNIEL
ncbi:MAG: metallophosphoesterase family protein [Bacilli bacterium]|nr:metallophosphoesterase family protein [Bacilli bacterium]